MNTQKLINRIDGVWTTCTSQEYNSKTQLISCLVKIVKPTLLHTLRKSVNNWHKNQT